MDFMFWLIIIISYLIPMIISIVGLVVYLYLDITRKIFYKEDIAPAMIFGVGSFVPLINVHLSTGVIEDFLHHLENKRKGE